MRLAIFIFVIAGFFFPFYSHAAVVINEIAWMGTDQDPNGSYCEWIELFNQSSSPVSLGGWLLSFGSVSIPFDAGASIEGGGYFLIERYTENACPDPVPGVDDYSASFGNGIGNAGTTLILKRTDLGIEDQIAGGTNWENVGGDNTTKETAQRTDSGWITAEGTPGAQNAAVGSPNNEVDTDTDEEKNTVSKASGTGTSEPPPSPVKTLRIVAPKTAYVNQPVEFDVVPGGSGERLIRYTWNFGDGSVGESRDPVHTYANPGMYVVIVESRFLGEDAMTRIDITVLPASLALARTARGDIQVHNNAKYEIDLGGFIVRGTKEFLIPKKTILLKGATLTIARSLIEEGSRGFVSVQDPMGTTLVSMLAYENSSVVEEFEEEVEAVDEPLSISVRGEVEEVPFEEDVVIEQNDAYENPEEPLVYRPAQVASVEASGDAPLTSMLPYLGLLGVLVVGILGVYIRKRESGN